MPTPAERRWEPIVRRARRSGTSIRAYAREHGINENTLAWWNWRFGDGLDDSGFVEVTVVEPCRPLHVHVGPARLEVDRETDLALLRQVVEALS
jgi:transposase-like protein